MPQIEVRHGTTGELLGTIQISKVYLYNGHLALQWNNLATGKVVRTVPISVGGNSGHFVLLDTLAEAKLWLKRFNFIEAPNAPP